MLIKQIPKINILIFLIFFTGNLFCAEGIHDKELVISNNGNFLFYNSPVATEMDENIFVTFLNNKGDVIVNKYAKDGASQIIDSYLVHNYKNKIQKNLKADDHAAPGIIYDKASKRLILSTSYHGTDLYIYEFTDNNNVFKHFKTIKGKYTYPRFVQLKSEILLFVRKIYRKNGQIFGDLVLFSSKDNFTKETTILTSYPDSVVYASRPYIYHNTVFLSYSMHDYQKGYLVGWKVLKFDPNSGKTLSQYDLSNFLPKDNYGNRPTSISISNNKLLVGTTYFNKTEYFKKERFFNRKNKILILETNLKFSNIKIVHKNTVLSPYYATDIYIDDKHNWIYFDKNKAISNKTINKKCFQHEHMMYPNIINESVFYAKVNNGNYSIRDFNNSIIQCPQYVK